MNTTSPSSVSADTVSSDASPSRYALGYWTPLTDQPGTHYEDVCEINADEFEAYRTAIASYGALTQRTTYVLLQRNRHALEATLYACSNVERMGGNFRLLDKQALGHTLTDELLNWLAAGMLYVQNNASTIRRQFGEHSDELRRFWKAHSCAAQFEGFRFAGLLRDYAQHAAPPASGLEFSRSATQRRSLDLYVLRSELLGSGMDWAANRRKLIEAQPEQIAVMPLVVEAMKGYRLIEDEVLLILLETCGAAIPKLREGIGRSAHQAGQHPCVLWFRDRDDGVDGIRVAQVSFPNSADLDRLQAALAEPDPLAELRLPAPAAPRRPAAMAAANRQAAALMSIWFAHGGDSAELQGAVEAALVADGARTLIPGLVNICAELTAMLSTIMGSAPESFIGIFSMDVAPPEGPQHQVNERRQGPEEEGEGARF